MDKKKRVELLDLTRRLVEEKAILVNTIRTYVIRQRKSGGGRTIQTSKAPNTNDIKYSDYEENAIKRLSDERDQAIRKKTMAVCRRLVKEKEVLVSQVQQLAVKLRMQQQNLLELQSSAKAKISQLKQEVEQLRKEKEQSIDDREKMAAELQKSRAQARHLRRAVVRFRSNKGASPTISRINSGTDQSNLKIESAEKFQFTAKKANDALCSDDDSKNNEPDPGEKSFPPSHSPPSSSPQSSNKVSSGHLVAKSKDSFDNVGSKTYNVGNHQMPESSTDNMQIKDGFDDNHDDSAARPSEGDDSDSVTHTVHVNNEMLIHLKTELDDDIPPPPSVAVSTDSNSDNVAVYQNNFENIAVAKTIEDSDYNGKHVVAIEVPPDNRAVGRLIQAPRIVEPIDSSLYSSNNDVVPKNLGKTSSEITVAQSKQEQSCVQHICNGEILIKYPTSHSVSSMIRQGIGGASAGATEKWVVVDQNNSTFSWGNVRARFTKKMSTVLRLESINRIYSPVPAPKSPLAADDKSKPHHSFTVETSSRDYLFLCPSMFSAATWIYGLQKLTLKANSTSERSRSKQRLHLFESRGKALIHLLKVYLDTQAIKRGVTRASLIVDALNLTVLDKLSGAFGRRNSSDVVNSEDSAMNAILNLPSVPTEF